MEPQKTILIVDDSEVDRFICTEIIKRSMDNINVQVAMSGENALDVIQQSGCVPDIILLDINMPRMDGFEFLEVFSKDLGNTQTPVMMLTSSLFEDDVERAKQYNNVKEFISKPLLLEHTQLIDRYFSDIEGTMTAV